MAERTQRAERLLNLVFCLMASSRPVPRSTIAVSVAGYESSSSDTAFERMFERDKDELRSLGVPIETVTDVNGEVLGYTINSQIYGMVEVALTQEEMTACALASIVWNTAQLSESGYMALRKLEVSSPNVTLRELPSLVKFSRVDERVFPILRAMRSAEQIRFTYQGISDDSPSERIVDPWGVVSIEGRWYLTGHDHARAAQRTFRISRITSEVDLTGSERQVPAPADFHLSEAVRARSEEPDLVNARMRIDGNAAGELLRYVDAPSMDSSTDSDPEHISVSGDRESLVMAILAQSDHVHELEGDEVKNDVREGLSKLLAVHDGG